MLWNVFVLVWFTFAKVYSILFNSMHFLDFQQSLFSDNFMLNYTIFLYCCGYILPNVCSCLIVCAISCLVLCSNSG